MRKTHAWTSGRLEAVGLFGVQGRIQLFRFRCSLSERDNGDSEEHDESDERDHLRTAAGHKGEHAEDDRDPVDQEHRLGMRKPDIQQPVMEMPTIRCERRDELQKYLNERKIGNSVYYPLPLHLQPCFAYLGYKQGSMPESERAAREVLSLPVYPELSRAQLDEVVSAVRGFFSR